MCVLVPGEVGVCAVTAAGCAGLGLQLQCSCAAIPEQTSLLHSCGLPGPPHIQK